MRVMPHASGEDEDGNSKIRIAKSGTNPNTQPQKTDMGTGARFSI